jgi:transcriptional regulator with GAF, ATPase, and Fis domain
MIRHLSIIVEKWMTFFKIRDERNLLASDKRTRIESQRNHIIARAPVMAKLLEQADHVATTDSSVLITGETGTGKELLASRIHHMSLQADGPFVVVDATTIPASLLESELFGHERGAFTGADQRKIGRIELAHKGTLFLDEIGELNIESQAKLLRTLQEKTFHRIGATQTQKSDFRLIAATNRNLAEEVEVGNFRRDLYFRLNVIPLFLPPLRDRGNDIILLANAFLNQYAIRYKKRVPELTPAQKKGLREYSWPGNVRELKNIMERAVILSTDKQINFDLPSPGAVHPPNRPHLDEIQRRYIQYILKYSGGKVSGPGGACEILGMKRTSLYSRMKALGITPSLKPFRNV